MPGRLDAVPPSYIGDQEPGRDSVPGFGGERDLRAEESLILLRRNDLHVERDPALAAGEWAGDLLEVGQDVGATDVPVCSPADRPLAAVAAADDQ